MTLTTSRGTSHVLNEHLDFRQYGPYAIPSWDDNMKQLFCKFGESNWNPDWVVALIDSFGTNYVLNDHENLGQYDLCAIYILSAIPSQIQLSFMLGESKWNLYWLIMFTSSFGINHAWRCWSIGPICNAIQENAMFKLSWKFGQSKWNPCWLIILTSSYGTNYVFNGHEDFDQYGSLAIPSEIMPCYSYPANLVNQNWVIVLTSSSDTNYALNEHEDFDQYGPYALPSGIMLCYNYPVSLENQTEIPIELKCQRAHLTSIISLTSMKMLTCMTYMQYHKRKCHVKPIIPFEKMPYKS